LVNSQEAQQIARQALKILRVKSIPENENPIEVLANERFLIMSSIEFDIVETTRKIASLLQQGDLKEASSYLKKLEELVSALDWE
jgi:hypothetical protein